MFVVIYSFKIKLEEKAVFFKVWREMTMAIRENCGGLGSRLHQKSDSEYIAYAIEQLKFPIGDYIAPEKYTLEILEKWISDIDSFPKSMEELCGSLTVEQLNWRYRPDGWKIKQVVHHCSDSHINQILYCC